MDSQERYSVGCLIALWYSFVVSGNLRNFDFPVNLTYLNLTSPTLTIGATEYRNWGLTVQLLY